MRIFKKKRIDLNYKPNALDKARFEFSPLGRAFNEGLDKTIPNYQEEGVTKLLKEIRDNLAGLAIPPGPSSSSSLPPSSPGPPSSPESPTLTNITPLSPPSSLGPSRKTRIVRPRPKLSLSNGQNFLDQLKLETSQRPKSPPVIPIMSKIPISKRFQSLDLDDVIKKQKQNNELNKKYDLNKLLKKQEQNDELNKLLEEQRDELNKLLKKQEQNDEQRNKQEKDIEWDKINKLRKRINELTENINSRSPTDFRTFTPKRNPFNDINTSSI